MVESSGNIFAHNQKENAVGAFQVRQCALTDVNKHYGLNYTLTDMYNPVHAANVFLKYLQMYGNSVRVWNGGPNGLQKTETIKYEKKYINQLNKNYE